MNHLSKQYFAKSIAGIALSLSILLTSTTLLTAKPVHAAAATITSTSIEAANTSSLAKRIIATGERFYGIRYKFGATSGITKSFDCSSFTQYVYDVNGITLPRSSKQQSKVGTYVPRSQLKPGDLVFFYKPVHHVAIYIGNGKILHTYGSPGVTISKLSSGWWSNHYATARRVL